MNLSQLRDLIALIDSSDINVLELKQPGSTLRLEIASSTGPDTPQTAAAPTTGEQPAITATAASTVITVPAPGFGIFTAQHPARDTRFCQDGQHVAAGDTLALLRINELYVPVTSNAAGQVRHLVAEGSLIGYGTALFEITPDQQ